MSLFGAAATGSTANAATDKDIEVADPPSDSISCLSWSPQADYLAASSWDNNVRLLTVLHPYDSSQII
jgi:mRNA export factor